MISGRIVFVFLLVCGFVALGSLSAQQKHASRTGWQRAVFVADDDQGIWIVENPEAVRNFPAAHVVVAGKFDSAKKTINVEKITPASQ